MPSVSDSLNFVQSPPSAFVSPFTDRTPTAFYSSIIIQGKKDDSGCVQCAIQNLLLTDLQDFLIQLAQFSGSAVNGLPYGLESVTRSETAPPIPPEPATPTTPPDYPVEPVDPEPPESPGENDPVPPLPSVFSILSFTTPPLGNECVSGKQYAGTGGPYVTWEVSLATSVKLYQGGIDPGNLKYDGTDLEGQWPAPGDVESYDGYGAPGVLFVLVVTDGIDTLEDLRYADITSGVWLRALTVNGGNLVECVVCGDDTVTGYFPCADDILETYPSRPSGVTITFETVTLCGSTTELVVTDLPP